MGLYEKTAKTVRIYESTANEIEKWRGNKSAGLFIDVAVKFYVKSFNEDEELVKIRKDIELILERTATSLGLQCEVLRQAGILNGNGEINFTKQ